MMAASFGAPFAFIRHARVGPGLWRAAIVTRLICWAKHFMIWSRHIQAFDVEIIQRSVRIAICRFIGQGGCCKTARSRHLLTKL